MKKIFYLAAGLVLLFAGCTKQQLKFRLQPQIQTQSAKADNPLSATSSLLHYNPTLEKQAANSLVGNLFPNNNPISNGSLSDFGDQFGAIKCPVPLPRASTYAFAFPDDVGDGVVPKPLCPEMEDFYSRILFGFSAKSPDLIYFEVYYKSSKALIYKKELPKVSNRSYIKAGDVKSIATKSEILNYIKNKDEGNTKILVTKLFNFLSTSVVTSN